MPGKAQSKKFEKLMRMLPFLDFKIWISADLKPINVSEYLKCHSKCFVKHAHNFLLTFSKQQNPASEA